MPSPYRSGATSPPTKDQVHSDLDLAFFPHPVTGRPGVRTNNDALIQAVRLTVLTNKYEAPYRPLLNDVVRERLFSNFSEADVDDLRRIVRTALTNHEPRVTLLGVEVLERRADQTLNIRIIVRPVGAANPLNVDVFLDRVR